MAALLGIAGIYAHDEVLIGFCDTNLFHVVDYLGLYRLDVEVALIGTYITVFVIENNNYLFASCSDITHALIIVTFLI